MISLHPPRNRPQAKDRQDDLQSQPSVAVRSDSSLSSLSSLPSRAQRRSAAMVQPVTVTTTFTLEGYAIREYKRIVPGFVVRSPTLVQQCMTTRSSAPATTARRCRARQRSPH